MLKSQWLINLCRSSSILIKYAYSRVRTIVSRAKWYAQGDMEREKTRIIAGNNYETNDTIVQREKFPFVSREKSMERKLEDLITGIPLCNSRFLID